ncbi:hypothetical protein [Kineococcus rubinsiae]|uniref:hypothetical protein n=1 Tax=Kineococcus rubinsiae TaxID=2609562 RepID=UPI0014322789|nr:hypothetical protein [Kineococcus rubinsiae]NIZ92592.1 hypothetical protein [Kineococcus rubinsiae]
MPPSRRLLPHPSATARVLALLGAVVALLGLLGATPARAATQTATRAATQTASGLATHPLVLVGTGGVSWSDVSASATPALAGMADGGAVGTVAVRSVFTAACPGDGWLALSSGRRATDSAGTSAEHVNAPCAPIAPVRDGVQPDFAAYTAIAARGTYGATPGLLGPALAGGGVSTAALGPGAGVALAGPDGRVAGTVVDPGGAGWEPAALGAAVAEQLAAGTMVVVVDAGAVRDPADLPREEAAPAASRAEQVALVDARVAAVQAAVAAAAGDPTLLVASIADAGRTPHLQFAAATGPAPGGGRYDGLLGSRSTRQTGILQTTDLAPTVLALALGSDTATAGLVGAPVTATDADASAADRVGKVRDLDLAAQAIQPLVPPFVVAWVLSQIVLFVVATIALRRAWGGTHVRPRVLAWLRRVAVVFGAVPASTYLANTIPWWRAGSGTGSHLLAVTAAVALFVAVLTALALLGPWRQHPLGPMGFVGTATALVLAVDVATGSRLVTSSLIGLQPVVAGRFYGLGNPQFALFAVGTLLLTVAVADRLLLTGHRRAATASVVVLGLAATAVDGVLGSDFGGPPAIIPAFGLLALLVAGVRVTWQRVLVIAAGTVLAIALIAVADWLRPTDDQTHLGRFVTTLLDGGAWQVVERKASQNLRILVGSWFTVVLPFAAAFIGWVLMRPSALGVSALQRTYDRHPVVKSGAVALLVLLGIGFVVNDSGTAVPAAGAMLAVPLLLAACTRVLETPGEAAAPAAGDVPAGVR